MGAGHAQDDEAQKSLSLANVAYGVRDPVLASTQHREMGNESARRSSEDDILRLEPECLLRGAYALDKYNRVVSHVGTCASIAQTAREAHPQERAFTSALNGHAIVQPGTIGGM